MKELVILLALISTTLAFNSISLTSCKRSKACFKTSKVCNVDTCQFAITWKPIKFKGNNYLEIEIVGDVYRDGGYIAIGFSDDKNMGDDGVIACLGSNTESQIRIVSGYNEASSNINTLFSDSDIDKNFIIKSFKDKYGGSLNPNTKRISCRFLRLLTPEKNKSKLKDLSQGNSYYMLVARGESSNLGSLQKHAPGTTMVTEQKIDFSRGTFNTVVGSSGLNSSLAKAHGILMIIAWISCCSVAIILGRYYKHVYPRDKNYPEGRWFNAHRGLQGCAFILLVIAIILIFIHVGGYSKLEDYPMKVHPILGLICSILFLINPFIALCRCNQLHKNRPVFNWIHFIVGTVAYILSIPTIMIGLRLPAAGFALSQLDSVQWIVFIFVIFQFCIEITLEIHACMNYKTTKSDIQKYEKEKDEHLRALNQGFTKVDEPVYPHQKGRIFKRIILGVYISVAILVTILLSVIIIMN